MVVSVGLLVVYHSSFPAQVPLWYSQPWGEDQLASPAWLWLMPVLIVAVGVVSLRGARRLANEKLLADLWLVGGVIVQLILALAVVRIIWLVVF